MVWVTRDKDGKEAIYTYDGQWKSDMKNGKGKYTIHKRNMVLEEYEGEWVDDRRHGVGMCRYGGPPKSRHAGHGEIEVGHYEKGLRVGKGVRWSADRSQAWELEAGRAVKDIEPAEAVAFAESLGIADPTAAPAEAPAAEETGGEELAVTKGFDDAP